MRATPKIATSDADENHALSRLIILPPLSAAKRGQHVRAPSALPNDGAIAVPRVGLCFLLIGGGTWRKGGKIDPVCSPIQSFLPDAVIRYFCKLL